MEKKYCQGEKATLAQGAELEFWGSGGQVRICVSVGLCLLIYRVIPSLSSSQVILVTSSVSIIYTASDLMVHVEGPDAPSSVWLSKRCVGAPVTVTEGSDALSHGRNSGLSPQGSATPPSAFSTFLSSLGLQHGCYISILQCR